MRSRSSARRALALLALLAAAALLALSGCGGDDGDGDSTAADDGAIATSDLSKADWIAEADAICLAANEALAETAEEQHGDQKPEGAEFDAFVTDEIAPSFRSQAEQIRELGAPAGDEEQVAAILDKLEQGAQQLADDPSLADDPEADLLIAEAGSEMQTYGAQVCGG